MSDNCVKCSARLLTKLPKAIGMDWDLTLVRQFFEDISVMDIIDFYLVNGMDRSYLDEMVCQGGEVLNFGLQFTMELDGTHFNRFKADGADALLAMIDSLDIPTFIVSNKDQRLLNFELKTLNMQDNFEVTVGSSPTAIKKPSPDLLIIAISTLEDKNGEQYCADDIWYVGDATTDVIAANLVGAKSILLDLHRQIHTEPAGQLAQALSTKQWQERSGITGDDAIAIAHPTCSIETLGELIAILHELSLAKALEAPPISTISYDDTCNFFIDTAQNEDGQQVKCLRCQNHKHSNRKEGALLLGTYPSYDVELNSSAHHDFDEHASETNDLDGI